MGALGGAQVEPDKEQGLIMLLQATIQLSLKPRRGWETSHLFFPGVGSTQALEKQPDLSVNPAQALSSCVTLNIDFNFSEAQISPLR